MTLIGNGLVKVLTPAVQFLNAALQKLIDFSTAVGQVFGGVFGEVSEKQSDVSQSAGSAAGAQNALADATNKAAKAAQGALASFDELNVLQRSTADSADDASDGLGDLGFDFGIDSPSSSVDIDYSKYQGIVDTIKRIIAPLQAINFDSAVKSFGRLKDAIAPFTRTIFDGLMWGYENLLAPLATWTIEEALPRFLDTLAISVDGLHAVVSGGGAVLQSFWDNFLKHIVNFSAEKSLQVWDSLNGELENLVATVKDSEIFQDFADVIGKIGQVIEPVVEQIINFEWTIAQLAQNAAFSLLTAMLRDIASGLGALSALLNGDIGGALGHLFDGLIGNKIQLVKDLLGDIGNAFLNFTGWSKDAVEAVDVLGEGISDVTRSKLSPFLETMRTLDDTLAGIDFKCLKIDDSIVQQVKTQVEKIRDIILNELDSDRNEALNSLRPLREALGEEAYNELVLANESYYQSLTEKVTAGEARINEIMAAAAAQNRELTAAEQSEILRIRDEMNDTGVKHLTESEIEYNTVMNRLKDNSTRISLEQASEIIQNAQATRDETVAAAETQYSKTELEAQRMLSVGAINKEQYDQIIAAAEKTRDDAIEAANAQYDTINSTTRDKLGENAQYIDSETGGIKSKWDIFCEGLSKGWHNMWAGIGNFFVSAWNGLVSGMESAINWFIDAINNIGITIPDWFKYIGLGSIAGKRFGFNLQRVSFGRVAPIEYLAEGGLAVSPTVAMIAEGRDREAVLPLNRSVFAQLGQGIVQAGELKNDTESLWERALYLLEIIAEKELKIGEDEVGRAAADWNNKEFERTGQSPLYV